MTAKKHCIWKDTADEIRELRAMLVVVERENDALRERTTWLEHRVNELELRLLATKGGASDCELGT